MIGQAQEKVDELLQKGNFSQTKSMEIDIHAGLPMSATKTLDPSWNLTLAEIGKCSFS